MAPTFRDMCLAIFVCDASARAGPQKIVAFMATVGQAGAGSRFLEAPHFVHKRIHRGIRPVLEDPRLVHGSAQRAPRSSERA